VVRDIKCTTKKNHPRSIEKLTPIKFPEHNEKSHFGSASDALAENLNDASTSGSVVLHEIIINNKIMWRAKASFAVIITYRLDDRQVDNSYAVFTATAQRQRHKIQTTVQYSNVHDYYCYGEEK